MLAALLVAAAAIVQVPKDGFHGTPKEPTRLVHAAFEVTVPKGWRASAGPYGADGIGLPAVFAAEKSGKGGDAVLTILAAKPGSVATSPKASTKAWGKVTWIVVNPELDDGERVTWTLVARGKTYDFVASAEVRKARELKDEIAAMMASFVVRDGK